MRTSLPLLAAMLVVSVPALAQERTAGSALDAQMSWAALSSKIDTAEGKVAGLDARFGQVVACGKQGKLYAPGAAEADAQGCKDTESALLTQVLTCNAQKMFWDGTSCVPLTICHYRNIGTRSAPNHAVQSMCPAGTTKMLVTGSNTNDHGGTMVSFSCLKTICEPLTDNYLLP